MTKPSKTPRLSLLRRNDVQGVVDAYKARAAAGLWSNEDAQTAVMLQDDPSEVVQALASAKDELDPPTGY